MINDSATARSTDRSDTGQWRLVVYLTRRSLEAWLQPLSDLQATRRIVSEEWEETGDGPALLAKIENCIYDHPQLLDDYTADIIIETDRIMWVPGYVADNDEQAEEIFGRIYGGDPDDMLTDRCGGGKGALWWFTPGLPAFLSRTFPGARVTSHLAALMNYLDSITLPGGDVMVLNTRPGSCDVILLRDGQLLSASTQRASTPEEAVYRLLRAASAYSIDPRQAHIAVRDESGDDTGLDEALEHLRLDASTLVGEERPLTPTAPLLILSR